MSPTQHDPAGPQQAMQQPPVQDGGQDKSALLRGASNIEHFAAALHDWWFERRPSCRWEDEEPHIKFRWREEAANILADAESRTTS